MVEDPDPAPEACCTRGFAASRSRGYSLDFEERRANVRIPTNETVSIAVLRPSVAHVEGRVLDISEGGMKLVVSQTFEPGTILQVRLEKRFVLAEVRYCMPHAGGFQIGVEIKDVFNLPASEPLQP